MVLWEIAFAKIPNINDITIKNKGFRLDGFEIGIQLLCMASIGTQMQVAYNANF
jgi:hypothetical protein